MTVYIDIFFIINFITDYIILVLSCGKCRAYTANRLFASLFGSAYACLSLSDIPRVFFSFPARLAVLFIMCVLSLFPGTIKSIFYTFVKAFGLSMLFSGSVLTVMMMFGKPFTAPLPDLLLAAAVFTACLCFKLARSSLMRNTNNSFLSISYGNKQITLCGRCDTGNLLKSFGGLPVIVADFGTVKKLFPKISSPAQLSEFVNPKDFRVIPYKTISDDGILYGFVPDKLTDEKKRSLKAVIAVAPAKLEAPLLYSPELMNV